jgi:MFS transporter, SP family, general alpha glucoside:H+ symporter
MYFILAGTLLQGLCCGGFGTLAGTYITDVCTPAISHALTGMISCCWIVGQLASYGVLWLMVNVEGHAAYRIPMALQWIIPVPVAIACLLAPPSPWWQVRRGNTTDALHALERLTSSPRQQRSRFGISPTDPAVLRLAEIQAVVAIETAQQTTDISFRECFRKSNRRRTEIAVMINISQVVVGFAIASQLVNFMRLAGLKSGDSVKMAFCKSCLLSDQWKKILYTNSSVNAIILLMGSVCYFIFCARLSTRTLYVGGIVCILPVLAMIGILEVLKRHTVINHQGGS